MDLRTRRLDRRELAERMQDRADRFRALAGHPWFTQDGREAMLAASDLYEARAESFRSRAS